MHIAIDILAAIILLFFFLAGCYKGFLLSLLGGVRVILAYGGAYFSGRYIGFWLGEIAHRPRIVTIPVCAGMTFALITFAFHLLMCEIRTRHVAKEKKEEFRRPVISCLSGGIIKLAGGTLSLILLFWLGDLFLVGAVGISIPGSDQAYFSRFARRTVYEAAYQLTPKQGRELQVASMAHMISNPAEGMKRLERVMAAESVQRLLTDPQLAKDILSGAPDRILKNASFQGLVNDRATLDELRELGMLSGNETRTGLSEKLAAVGQNKKIQTSIESLRARNMLSTDKIPLLLRDPDFDIILGELVK